MIIIGLGVGFLLFIIAMVAMGTTAHIAANIAINEVESRDPAIQEALKKAEKMSNAELGIVDKKCYNII